MFKVFNLFNFGSENENVLRANLLIYFNISSIHCSDNKSSIHHKLHIASSRGLSTSCRNMLTQFRSRNDHLSIGNVVVRKKDNFEYTFCLSVVINNQSNLVYQFNDKFGVVIGWGRFTWKHNCSGNYIFTLLRSHLLYRQIAINNIKYVHKLSFVLMNSLDLDIKHWIFIDGDFAIMVDPFGQSPLIIQLDCLPFWLEVFIFSVLLDLSQSFHIHNPFVSFQILCVEICQKGISAENPPPGSNAVCYVYEFSWEELVKIFEKSSL